MKISIQPRNDVSYLFSNQLTGNTGMGNNNWLSDYASIKNGSYGKLMRAYYGDHTTESAKRLAGDKVKNYKSAEDNKTYAKVKTDATKLKTSAEALTKDNLYEQKDIISVDDKGKEIKTIGYDTEAIFGSMAEFVENYNSVIKSANNTEDSSIQRRISNLAGQSLVNWKNLQSIGITVNQDDTLSINKESFMKADMRKVKELFHEKGSYGDQISVKASMIGNAAERATATGSSYTGNGVYNLNFNSGNLFNGFF